MEGMDFILLFLELISLTRGDAGNSCPKGDGSVCTCVLIDGICPSGGNNKGDGFVK